MIHAHSKSLLSSQIILALVLRCYLFSLSYFIFPFFFLFLFHTSISYQLLLYFVPKVQLVSLVYLLSGLLNSC